MKNTLKKLSLMVLTIFNVPVYFMFLLFSLSTPETYAGNATPTDYSIVTKVEPGELGSLKIMLSDGEALKRPVELSNIIGKAYGAGKTFPQILYQIDMGKTSDSSHTDFGDTIKFSVGNSLILNDKGFFVTAYHCVEKFGKETTGNNRNFLMMYGPVRNMVIKGRILTFSEKYDLALGQVDLPDDIHVEDVRITQAAIEPAQLLYARRFRNIDYIKRDLLINMLFPDSSDIRADSDILSVFMRDPDPKWKLPLGLEVCIGYTVVLKSKTGLRVSGPKSGQYFLMTGLRETVEGHSGSPVFSVNGELAGIVVAIPLSNTFTKNANGEAVRITYFTGPEKIRELISNYIEVCTGTETKT